MEIKFLNSVADGWVRLSGFSSSGRAMKPINSIANGMPAGENSTEKLVTG